MKRLVILMCLVLIGVAAYLFNATQATSISVFDAKAVQSAGNPNMYMVGLSIENSGDPDRLLGVSSASAPKVFLMNPSGNDLPLIIPQNGKGILAMDGAHVMLMAMPGTFEQGGFLPLNLTFEKAGPVSVRVENSGPSTMNHGAENGILESPTPELSIAWASAPTANGANLTLDVKNFTFDRAENGPTHIKGHGHAHVYLNGLKLGRLYSDSYQLGPLSPGHYSLSIALNSNDHRPYLNEAGPVAETLEFDITN